MGLPVWSESWNGGNGQRELGCKVQKMYRERCGQWLVQVCLANRGQSTAWCCFHMSVWSVLSVSIAAVVPRHHLGLKFTQILSPVPRPAKYKYKTEVSNLPMLQNYAFYLWINSGVHCNPWHQTTWKTVVYGAVCDCRNRSLTIQAIAQIYISRNTGVLYCRHKTLQHTLPDIVENT